MIRKRTSATLAGRIDDLRAKVDERRAAYQTEEDERQVEVMRRMYKRMAIADLALLSAALYVLHGGTQNQPCFLPPSTNPSLRADAERIAREVLEHYVANPQLRLAHYSWPDSQAADAAAATLFGDRHAKVPPSTNPAVRAEAERTIREIREKYTAKGESA